MVLSSLVDGELLSPECMQPLPENPYDQSRQSGAKPCYHAVSRIDPDQMAMPDQHATGSRPG